MDVIRMSEVIEASRLEALTSFPLFHDPPRRSELLCAIGYKLKPLHNEAFGGAPDAYVGFMMRSPM
jgi:hypothetical protein